METLSDSLAAPRARAIADTTTRRTPCNNLDRGTYTTSHSDSVVRASMSMCAHTAMRDARSRAAL